MKNKLFPFISILILVILFGTSAICNQCGIIPEKETIVTLSEISDTNESASDADRAQENTEQTTAGEISKATKPTVNIDRIYGPVKEGDLCVQRFKATINSSPGQTIKWNHDDSNGAFGEDVAQINLKSGKEFELKVTVSNSAGSASATIHVRYELPEQPSGTTQTASFTFDPKSGPDGTEVKLKLSESIDSPVEVYYNGQKILWVIFTKTASPDGKTLTVNIPVGASSDYFEMKWDGKSVKSSEQFIVTVPTQADLAITNVKSYSSKEADTIIVDFKNVGATDLNNTQIHVVCTGNSIMYSDLNKILPIASDEWIFVTVKAGESDYFFPYLILNFTLYIYPDVVCRILLDGDPTPDNNVFGISIP